MEEALRYMHVPPTDEATRRLAEEAAGLMEKRLHPRYLWRACRIERGGEGIFLPEAALTLPGTLAEKMLAECGTAVLMVTHETDAVKYADRVCRMNAGDLTEEKRGSNN